MSAPSKHTRWSKMSRPRQLHCACGQTVTGRQDLLKCVSCQPSLCQEADLLLDLHHKTWLYYDSQPPMLHSLRNYEPPEKF